MKRSVKTIAIIVMVALLSSLLVSCLPGDGSATAERPAGLLSGIWHGWIAPVSLITGIFNHKIRVYEPNNAGWWYDFGFYIAIIGGFGGIALSRKARRDR